MFTQNVDIILLFDSVYDEENGVGVQLLPSSQVVPHDIFL